MASEEGVLKGLCFFHSETGTEGGYWAFQDSRHISPKGDWSYEGLHVLRDGDRLTIFSLAKPDEIVWSGVIKLLEHPLFTEDAFGLWVHADQVGVDRDVWARWFYAEYPAELIPAIRA
jgi:hypothetical protein